MQSEGNPDPGDVFAVLADDYARRILVAADRQPMTAKALSEACDSSLATVYRRVSTLQEYGLLEERTAVDPDGAHRSEFVTTLEGLSLELTDGDLSLTLDTRDELADNFTALWDDLRGDE
ncbi:helix-turn-helix domain-containing protein [Natribaculum luteum]|uniref:Helix-turn-helix domain-containing protein n=1 Tax=Natribaculum luteum TaxID=1586232 RepID=A0ABD5P3V8_9EURY|nr:helix-turn-helix domain-containing protein [Natribaculum luteum]